MTRHEVHSMNTNKEISKQRSLEIRVSGYWKSKHRFPNLKAAARELLHDSNIGSVGTSI